MQFGVLVDAVSVLGGIQLGLLAEVPLCEIGGRVLGACSCDGRVLDGM